jgi:hypothetical protein
MIDSDTPEIAGNAPDGRVRPMGSMAARTVSLVLLAVVGTAHAQESGRLLATEGVTQIEGAAGGGLVPWALITGYGTRDAVGANIHYSLVPLPDFTLNSGGAAVGLYDRLELSYAHQWLDTGQAGARLGLGAGYQFRLDVVGAKLRLFGDAVYDQDSWLPQVAVGTQYKSNDQASTLHAIGAASSHGVDFYVAATKLFLAQSVLVNVTVRATQANQFGLLGFGGDRKNSYSLETEGSAAYLVSEHIAVGGEFRTSPSNLSFAGEGTAYDAFATWFVSKNLSTTAGVTALGNIARQKHQTGGYLSVQAGF